MTITKYLISPTTYLLNGEFETTTQGHFEYLLHAIGQGSLATRI